MPAATYSSRPASVQAHQWDGTHKDAKALGEWLQAMIVAGQAGAAALEVETGPLRLSLATHFGIYEIEKDDWIIVNDNGVVFMASNEAFREKYEPVPDTTKELIN